MEKLYRVVARVKGRLAEHVGWVRAFRKEEARRKAQGKNPDRKVRVVLSSD